MADAKPAGVRRLELLEELLCIQQHAEYLANQKRSARRHIKALARNVESVRQRLLEHFKDEEATHV